MPEIKKANGEGIGNYPIQSERTPSTEVSANLQQPKGTAPQRKSGALWVTLAVLAIAIALVGGYDYFAFHKHNVQLAQLPGVMDSLTGVTKRLADAEGKLSAWTDNQDALGGRVSRLETKFAANFRDLQKQTRGMVTKFQEETQRELNQRAEVTDARLSRLESAHEAEQMQLARLQEQMAGAQRQVASARQDIDSIRKDSQGEMASLRQQETQSEDKLQTISNQLARERVDFEVKKNETRELAPGISLHIIRTNVSYQRFSGYMDFVSDSRTLWIADQGVQQPVTFRSKQGGEPYELVATGVNKRGIAGYLLLPKADSGEARSSGSAGRTNSGG